MKPNFEKMSRKELRAYVLAHRDDMEALETLFNKRSPDEQATWFHPPKTQKEEQEQFELFKHMIEKIEGNIEHQS
jgi:hypothetical protein